MLNNCQTHFLCVFIMFVYITLCVVTVPPRMVNSSRDITVDMSDDIRLECFAAGIPNPNISWFRHMHTGQRIGWHLLCVLC